MLSQPQWLELMRWLLKTTAGGAEAARRSPADSGQDMGRVAEPTFCQPAARAAPRSPERPGSLPRPRARRIPGLDAPVAERAGTPHSPCKDRLQEAREWLRQPSAAARDDAVFRILSSPRFALNLWDDATLQWLEPTGTAPTSSPDAEVEQKSEPRAAEKTANDDTAGPASVMHWVVVLLIVASFLAAALSLVS